MESLNLMCDSCHEDFILGALHLFHGFVWKLFRSSMESSGSCLDNDRFETYRLASCHFDLYRNHCQLGSSSPLNVNIFPVSVTTLLSKLIYSSTKVIIFLNWYKY